MTVCIVSRCTSGEKRTAYFVNVCDSMITLPDMSADALAVKSFSIGENWLSVFSANDMSAVNAVANVAKQEGGLLKFPQVVGLFQSAFRAELLAKAEASILAPLSISMAEFRKDGLANFGPEIFSRLFYQIEQLSLDATFLVHGFDEEVPHVFSIQGRGEVSYYDQPGFWAIGSGQTIALGSLFSCAPSPVYFELGDLLYLLCRAKFSAESAPGVGRSTNAVILRSDGERFFVFNTELERLRKKWEATRQEAVPKQVSELANEIVSRSLSEEGRTKSNKSSG
jgi:hypothetical protein